MAQRSAAAPGWTAPGVGDGVIVSAPDGGVAHPASGYHFPAALGPMPLRKTAVLGPRDVMVGYADRGGGDGDPWLDLIVYDYGHPLKVEAASAEADMRRIWTTIAPAPGMIRTPARAEGASSRWFRGVLDGRRMVTDFVMVQRGPWIIEARASCPEESGDAGLAKMQAALDAIVWRLDGSTV